MPPLIALLWHVNPSVVLPKNICESTKKEREFTESLPMVTQRGRTQYRHRSIPLSCFANCGATTCSVVPESFSSTTTTLQTLTGMMVNMPTAAIQRATPLVSAKLPRLWTPFQRILSHRWFRNSSIWMATKTWRAISSKMEISVLLWASFWHFCQTLLHWPSPITMSSRMAWGV